MKKIRFFILFLICIVCLFVLTINAEDVIEEPTSNYEYEQGVPYYLIEDVPGRYYVFLDSEYIEDPVSVLFTSEYLNFLESAYDDYQDELDNGTTDEESFADYMINGFSNAKTFAEDRTFFEKFETMKENQSNSGGSSSGTGGGTEGDDGSSSSGSQNGTPNVTINPEVDISKWDKCFCGSSGGDYLCSCYKTGFGDGWTAALESDAVKQALQEAFDQGFREVNTDSWHDTVANEKEQAVNQYKESEEQKALIESEKEKAIQEYKESDKYVEELTEESSSLTDKQKEAKEKISEKAVEDFKNSPEQLEIIGQAQKDAVADFVVEMESIFGGEGVPSEGPAAEYGSKIEEMIDGAKQDAVNEFSSSIQSALGGSGVPGTGGTPGEGVPGDGTPEGDLMATIQNNINVAYNNGVTQGVSDFKVGLEYKTSLKTEYNAGSEAGYSKGYSAGTNDGYADGLIDGAEAANVRLYEQGKEDFKNGEYAQVINDTYIKGYEDGAANVESVNPAVIVAPLAILAVLIIALTIISKKTKKKR